MMRKRLLCVALTLAMLFSAQSAAAAAQTGNTRSMIITADTRLPTISVTVPGSAWVLINPYRLDVDIDGDETDEQIICAPCYIISESDIPLDVGVKVTAAVNTGSDMVLATSSTKGSTGGSKRAFVYFEMQYCDSEDLDVVEWDSAYNPAKHILVTTAPEGNAKSGVLRLDPLTPDMYLGEKGCAAFRLTGDAAVAPENAWTSDDGLNVSVAFTFTPVPYV